MGIDFKSDDPVKKLKQAAEEHNDFNIEPGDLIRPEGKNKRDLFLIMTTMKGLSPNDASETLAQIQKTHYVVCKFKARIACKPSGINQCIHCYKRKDRLRVD